MTNYSISIDNATGRVFVSLPTPFGQIPALAFSDISDFETFYSQAKAFRNDMLNLRNPVPEVYNQVFGYPIINIGYCGVEDKKEAEQYVKRGLPAFQTITKDLESAVFLGKHIIKLGLPQELVPEDFDSEKNIGCIVPKRIDKRYIIDFYTVEIYPKFWNLIKTWGKIAIAKIKNFRKEETEE